MEKDFDVKVTIKNGRLLRTILERYDSIADFSRDIGRSTAQLHKLVGMKVSPYARGQWTELAFDVAAWLGKDPEDLWPEHMKELRLKRNTSGFQANLHEIQELSSNIGPERQIMLADVVDKALKDLTPKESLVMRRRYFDEFTLLDVAEELGVSQHRAWQIEIKAQNKLRAILKRYGYSDSRNYGAKLTQDGLDLLADE